MTQVKPIGVFTVKEPQRILILDEIIHCIHGSQWILNQVLIIRCAPGLEHNKGWTFNASQMTNTTIFVIEIEMKRVWKIRDGK
jgi:hypothetical protein